MTQENAPLLNHYIYDRQLEHTLSENPHTYILLLLERSLERGAEARACHENNDLVAKGFHLGRMVTLLDALRDRLVFDGAENLIAYNFADLYDYIDANLQQAIREAGTEHLDSALLVFTELKNAWEEAIALEGKTHPI